MSERQSEVAIIDVTGVPVIDTAVAGHLFTTIQAVEMLGAKVIITGISPHNAQTVSELGIPIDKFCAKGTLQAGLKYAFDITGNLE